MDNRGELNDIESRSDDLRDTASRFRLNSNKLEQMARLRNLKMKIIIGILLIAMMLIIYYFVL